MNANTEKLVVLQLTFKSGNRLHQFCHLTTCKMYKLCKNKLLEHHTSGAGVDVGN